VRGKNFRGDVGNINVLKGDPVAFGFVYHRGDMK
jgi:hypothetical protein